jgi:hypothetical protein
MFRSAQSSAITDSAPSHDNSVELFSRASVPPATVSKNNPERNHVSAATVHGEHMDDYAFLGKASGVPFRFSHPSPLFRAVWKRPARGASQTATNSGQRGHLGRLERKRNTHFGLSLDQMRRKARREWKNCLDIKKVVGMDQTRRSKEFTIPGIAKIGSPEIHHKCGVSATNFPARCSTESTRGGTSARPRTMRAGECGHDAGAFAVA